MDKALVILILLANLLSTNCQEGEIVEDNIEETTDKGKSAYSFSYGVSDGKTGDVKSVWESRDGDTVKGHYSVVEPDGSTRTVEYSAGPNTGFQAVVNTDNPAFESEEIGRSIMEEKAMRDYERYYDFSEDPDEDYYETRKRPKRPPHKEHSNKKRTRYPSYSDQPLDSEPSDYTHSITIKHPRDDSSEFEPQSHVGYSFDPNCKTKTKKESHNNRDNLYTNIVDLELNKKYPTFPEDTYRDTYDKFAEPTFDFDRYVKYYGNGNFKGHKYEDINIKPSASSKYPFPVIPDALPEKYYPDEIISRPKRKKPHKHREPDHRYPSDDINEYILVPKKKLKKPTPPPVDTYDYRVTDDDYERPQYSNNYDDTSQDDRYPIRGTGPKEVVRKIVKKRKPVINLLDMFDI